MSNAIERLMGGSFAEIKAEHTNPEVSDNVDNLPELRGSDIVAEMVRIAAEQAKANQAPTFAPILPKRAKVQLPHKNDTMAFLYESDGYVETFTVATKPGSSLISVTSNATGRKTMIVLEGFEKVGAHEWVKVVNEDLEV